MKQTLRSKADEEILSRACRINKFRGHVWRWFNIKSTLNITLIGFRLYMNLNLLSITPIKVEFFLAKKCIVRLLFGGLVANYGQRTGLLICLPGLSSLSSLFCSIDLGGQVKISSNRGTSGLLLSHLCRIST